MAVARKSPRLAAKSAVSAITVLLYYPNLIGYLRIACMVASFYYSSINWQASIICYLLAFGGDVVDGWFARHFNQTSTFGGVLDMVTDRVSTCGLLAILSSVPAYSEYRFAFVMLISLDVFSHWFHVASVSGHHKSSSALLHRNPLLQWYYSIYPLFGFCCVGTELFYVYLYYKSVASHMPIASLDTPIIQATIFNTLFAACALKQAVNIVQLCSAGFAIAEIDAESRGGRK